MSRPKKRKITLTLTPRVAQDPLAIFQAVEDVFRPEQLDIRVGDSPLPAQSVADEPLETEVSKVVGAALDEKARRLEGQSAPDSKTNALTPADAKKIVKLRSRLWQFCKDLAWKLTVSLVADGVKFVWAQIRPWLFAGAVVSIFSKPGSADAPLIFEPDSEQSAPDIVLKTETAMYIVQVKDEKAP
jgi:hypothetical protein